MTSASAEVELRAFGCLTVSVRSAPQPNGVWSGPERRLLGLLLAVPRHQVAAREAARLLWPGRLERSQRASLRMALLGLRRRLEPGLKAGPESRYLIRSGPDCRLHVERTACDVAAFTELVEGVRWPLDRASAARLEEAVGLYRGDFLAMESFEGAPSLERLVQRRRAQLCQTALTAAGWLRDWYRTAGRTPPEFHLRALAASDDRPAA